MNIIDLVREDLRDFGGYSSARRSAGGGPVWLNANESPWRNPSDGETAAPGCNRYPEPQPAPLIAALAQLYGATPSQLLVGRGSDEAIDLLVRALCRPQRDAVLVSPPVFGMYAVCARMQGAPLVEVPLRDGVEGFSTDVEAVATTALARAARLVFLCSPANPTGQSLSLDEIDLLAERLAECAIVVVDEAYGEYAEQPSAVSLMASRPNLAVLRTLSKAHALAAARIGTLIADPQLISVLRNCQAPYPLPRPCVQLALDALAPQALVTTAARVQMIREQRQRLFEALPRCDGVRRVYPSQGNYLLVRFDDAGATHRRLLEAGVVVRDMRSAPQLEDALRISVGSEDENDVLLAALQARRAVA